MQELSKLGRACLDLGLKFYAKNKTKCPLAVKLIQRRTMCYKTSDRVAQKFMKDDGVPSGYNLIYRASMHYYMRACYSITFAALFYIGYSIYYYFYQDIPFDFDAYLTESTKFVSINSYRQYTIMMTGTALTTLMFHRFSGQYVLRMYYNPKTKIYRAILPKILPAQVKTHEFKANTVVARPHFDKIPMLNSQYKCNGKKLLLFEEMFAAHAFYEQMFVKETPRFLQSVQKRD